MQQLISHGAGHASEIRIVKNQDVRNARVACGVLSHVPSRWSYQQQVSASVRLPSLRGYMSMWTWLARG
jgi:hypothetical protein